MVPPSVHAKAGVGVSGGEDGAGGVAPTDQPCPGAAPGETWGRMGGGLVAGKT